MDMARDPNASVTITKKELEAFPKDPVINELKEQRRALRRGLK